LNWKRSPDAVEFKYFVGALGIYRAELFAALANQQPISSARRSDYWRKARDFAKTGVTIVEEASALYPLDDELKEMREDGIAVLAQAEAVISKSFPGENGR
jgi:hypothetical protein